MATEEVTSRDYAKHAADAVVVTAIAVACVLALCFVVGMGSGASVAGEDLLHSPTQGVEMVDDQLQTMDSPGPLAGVVIAAWPILKAPVLAGVSVGLAYPTLAEIAYWLAFVGLAIAAVHQVYSATRGEGDE